MTTTAPEAKRTRRRLIAVVLLAAALFCGYRMFDYALTWSSGWKPLPTAAVTADSFVDPQWSTAGAAASATMIDIQQDLPAPAVSAAISMDGRRIWAHAVGLADIDNGIAVRMDSSFRLGSTSKAINSVALGTLLDGKRIDLDAPVRQYLGDISEPVASITTRQAISHTAGVRDYGLCLCFPVWEQFSRRDFGRTARAGLSVFASDPLLFTPGSDFSYSSHGTNVAGAVIEAVAGVGYLDYLQTAVFDPLDMTNSSGDDAHRSIAQRVQFYDVQEGRYKRAYAVDNSIKWPSGGIISTPSDMLRLGESMLQSRLFSTATRDLLITPQPLADGRANPQGYALGWRYFANKKLFDGQRSTPFYTHHGVAVGSISYFAVYPEFDLVISLMANRSDTSVDALAAHATRLVEIFIADKQQRTTP